MVKYTDQTLMPFGKHKGTALTNVPAKDLIYYYEENYNMPEGLREYIKENLEVLRTQKKRDEATNKSDYKNRYR